MLKFHYLFIVLLFSACPHNPEITTQAVLNDATSIDSSAVKDATLQKSVSQAFNWENADPKVVNIQLSEEGDQTEALQNQLDTIPSGTAKEPVLVKFPEGRFHVEGTLRPKQFAATLISNKKHWIIDASKTTLYVNAPSIPFGGNVNKGNYSHRRQFVIKDCDSILLKGLTVEGANKLDGSEYGVSPESPEWWKGKPDKTASKNYGAYVPYWEFEHGIAVVNSNNITIDGIKSFNVFGDGIYAGGGKLENIRILNSTVLHVGRQGIATNGIMGLEIDNVNIDEARRSGIDLETDYPEHKIWNVKITNSVIKCHLTPFAAGGPGDVSYVLIDNNKYSGSGNSVFCRSNKLKVARTNWTFSNNERLDRYTSSAPALKFGRTSNVIITGNIDSYSGKYYVGNSFFENMTVKDNQLGKSSKIIRVADFTGLDLGSDYEILNNTDKIPVEEREYSEGNNQ